MNKIIKFICSIIFIGTILSCSNQNNSSSSITMFKDNYDLKEHKSESTFEELSEFMNEKRSFYLKNFKNNPSSFEFLSSARTNQYLDEELFLHRYEDSNVVFDYKNSLLNVVESVDYSPSMKYENITQYQAKNDSVYNISLNDLTYKVQENKSILETANFELLSYIDFFNIPLFVKNNKEDYTFYIDDNIVTIVRQEEYMSTSVDNLKVTFDEVYQYYYDIKHVFMYVNSSILNENIITESKNNSFYEGYYELVFDHRTLGKIDIEQGYTKLD